MFLDVKEAELSEEMIKLVSKEVAEGKLFLPQKGQKWQPMIINPLYGPLQLANVNIDMLKFTFTKYRKGWSNMYTRPTSCCGLFEIATMYDGPQDPKYLLSCIYNDMDFRGRSNTGRLQSCAFFVFTDIVQRAYGTSLQKLIEEEGLGKVIKSSPQKNPNSGNMVTTWVWEVNHNKFVDLYPKYKKAYAEYIKSLGGH